MLAATFSGCQRTDRDCRDAAEAYRIREVSIRDPDGYIVCFSVDATHT